MVVVVVEDELLVDEDETDVLELELELRGPEVDVELDGVVSSSIGASVGGRGTPTSAVLETLGWVRPAGPAANARRMLPVTCNIRQRMVEEVVMVSPQVTSSSSGDQPKVPAENTPAPLGVVYQVESA